MILRSLHSPEDGGKSNVREHFPLTQALAWAGALRKADAKDVPPQGLRRNLPDRCLLVGANLAPIRPTSPSSGTLLPSGKDFAKLCQHSVELDHDLLNPGGVDKCRSSNWHGACFWHMLGRIL